MDVSIERLAEISVARGCGFALLGIVTTMTGFSAEPAQALKAGGILTLMTCAVLLLKAFNALRRPYKSTEVWIMLPKTERPKAEVAQQLIGCALRGVYMVFAKRAALLSIVLLSLAQGSAILSPASRMW